MEIGEGIEGLDEEEVYQRVETKKTLHIERKTAVNSPYSPAAISHTKFSLRGTFKLRDYRVSFFLFCMKKQLIC